MRDAELMITLLKEMASDSYGHVMITETLGMGEDKLHRIHQLELLADAGLADWRSDSMARITNSGYDLIAAIDQANSIKRKFLNWLALGWSLAKAAAEAIELAGRLESN